MADGFRGWERYLFGAASAPEQSRESGRTPFQKGMEWIKQFLNAQADPPTDVDFSRVLMAGDILQDGWPWAVISNPIAVQGAGAALANFEVLPLIDSTGGTQNFTAGLLAQPYEMSILALTIAHTGGAGPGTVYLGLGRVAVGATGAAGAGIAQLSIAVGGQARLIDAFGSAVSPVCPPGWAYTIQFPATAGGETYQADLVVAARPAGFRP